MNPTINAHRALLALGHTLLAQGYRFVTVTPATHRRVNRRPGNAWAHDLRGVLGWSRPFRPGVLAPAIEGRLREGGLLEPCEGGGQRARVRASSIGAHLYFHSAWPTSDEDDVFFGPDTYRYAAALHRSLDAFAHAGRPIRRAVDIGAGSGAAAIELALRQPGATVYAADINPQAMAMARVNAELNGAANVVVCESDLLDGVEGELDLVMSNPPYILDPDQLTYRHGGGEHGAELSIRIVRQALDRLAPGGALLLYTGVAIVDGEDRFLAGIRAWLDQECAAWQYEELDPDVFGGQLGCEGYEDVERIAAVWLQATKRG